MTDHAVTYDDTSVIRRDYPEAWASFHSLIGCTATFRDLEGTVLDTGAAVTPATVKVTTQAPRGSITLTGETASPAYQWEAGDVGLLTTPGGATEFVTVVNCVVTTAAPTDTVVITLRSRLEETHAITGSAVATSLIPWWCSYSLDTTDTDTWPLSGRGTVTWQPDVAAPALVDSWQTRGLLRDAGTLRAVFSELFPRVAAKIRDDLHWAALLEHCEGNLADWLRGKGAQRESLVDRGPVQRLLLVTIADHIASVEGEELAGENERIGKVLASQRATFLSVLHAQDVKQDHIVKPTDNLHMQMPPIARQW